MTDTKKPSDTKEPALEVYWGKSEHLDLVYVDNLHLQRVNDSFYMTFGQLRLPSVEPGSASVVAEIRPVTRLVIPKESLKRIADLLRRNLKVKDGESE